MKDKELIKRVQYIADITDPSTVTYNHLKAFITALKNEERTYTAAYFYVSPADTLTEGEKHRFISQVITGTLQECIDMVEENFDGKDTFEENYIPEIKEHFKDGTTEEYYGDDWSAGQWFYIHPVVNGSSTEITFEG